MQQPQQKKRQQTYVNDSVVESLRNLGSGIGKTVAGDVVGKVGADTLSALFGGVTQKQSGELRQNEAVDVGREIYDPTIRRPEIKARQPIQREEPNLKAQIEAVRTELKALAVSLKELHSEVQNAIREAPVTPGIYHLNFFERLRAVIRLLRQQIEDSRTWLALWSSRKQKKQYWGMYKKHGTQFGLSSERTVSTQAG